MGFFVPSREDLAAWAAKLDALDIPHSGVKAPAWSTNAVLTFGDPDHTRLFQPPASEMIGIDTTEAEPAANAEAIYRALVERGLRPGSAT